MRAISISRALAMHAAQLRCRFLVNGDEEPALVLLSPEVFLPVVALHADMQARNLAGTPLGVRFREDDQSLLGVSVDVPNLCGDEASVLRLLFFADAAKKIFGLHEDARIECAPVFEAYQHGLMNHIQRTGAITWPMAQVSPR